MSETSITADTDHGVYDALPTRESDDAPAGSVLTVFRDGGSVAGYVMGREGHYAAVLATDCGNRLITCTAATLAGAVSMVADRDRG